jgi:hypothetical protein
MHYSACSICREYHTYYGREGNIAASRVIPCVQVRRNVGPPRPRSTQVVLLLLLHSCTRPNLTKRQGLAYSPVAQSRKPISTNNAFSSALGWLFFLPPSCSFCLGGRPSSASASWSLGHPNLAPRHPVHVRPYPGGSSTVQCPPSFLKNSSVRRRDVLADSVLCRVVPSAAAPTALASLLGFDRVTACTAPRVRIFFFVEQLAARMPSGRRCSCFNLIIILCRPAV